MIVVTVELWPLGDESLKRHLGIAVIANDATGTPTIGNYRVVFSKAGRPKAEWRRAAVSGFPRKRLGAWDLLYRCLKVAVGDRNDRTNP